MWISKRQAGDALVVDFCGRLHGHKAAEVLEDAVNGNHAREGVVVANLGEVRAMDNRCLDILVGASRSARAAGRAFRLAGVTRRLQDLVVITRLLTECDTFETVEAALGDAAPARPAATTMPGLAGLPADGSPQFHRA
jgi:anti-anti-sigma factor